MKRILCFGLLVSSCTFAAAQKIIRTPLPTGEEITKAAEMAMLNHRASVTAEKDGKKVTVTPVDSTKTKTSQNLEKGQVVGLIDVEGIPELPNGKYVVFVRKSAGRWQAIF